MTKTKPGTDGQRGTTSAGRVADVLLAVADAPGPAGVSDIARSLALSKAVVYRILRSLVDRGLVTDSSGRGMYQLGTAALRLGAQALGSIDLRPIALPVLRELQVATGETTTISALTGLSRMYLDQVESRKEIRMTVELGRPFPLHAGGSGKAILAFAPPDIRDAVLEATLPAVTDQTITDVTALRQELEQIRSSGVARSRGERESGAASVAAPVNGIDGLAIGSVSVCGPRDRLDLDRLNELAPAVQEAARSVMAGIARRAPAGVG